MSIIPSNNILSGTISNDRVLINNMPLFETEENTIIDSSNYSSGITVYGKNAFSNHSQVFAGYYSKKRLTTRY